MYKQFNTSYRSELAELISMFHELNEVHQKTLCLYLDSDIWEIFDQRFCTTIIRHKYKHVKAMIEDMRTLHRAVIEAGTLKYRLDRPTRLQTWSVNHLKKLYPEHYKFFIYGKL